MSEQLNLHDDFIRRLIQSPLDVYAELRGRFLSRAQLAESFTELWPVLDYLLGELMSKPVLDRVQQDATLAVQYKLALQDLRHVALPNRRMVPYLETIRAITKVVEFFDVLVRSAELTAANADLGVFTREEENPRARQHAYYHRYRYLYRFHQLLERLPEIFLLPSHRGFSARNMLRFRCVPVFVLWVATQSVFVDEFDQTPVEAEFHDGNHAIRQDLANRRWFAAHGIVTAEERAAAYRQSYEFSRPLLDELEYAPGDTEEEMALKDLKIVILFETTHEDAEFFMPDVLSESLQRVEGFTSQFEVPVIDAETGLMDIRDTEETGIATLAYVRQKLQNGFYDRVGSAHKGIVARPYRTTRWIARAAYELLERIGAEPEAGVPADDRGNVSYDWLLERACSFGPEIVHPTDILDEDFRRRAPATTEVNIKRYFDVADGVSAAAEASLASRPAVPAGRPPLAEIRLTADVLAFGQIDGQTHVLLVQRDQDPYKGTWSLPGAFVWEVETSQEAAYRALRVKTGLQAVELQQYGLFDTVDRDPRTRVASTTYLGELAPSEVHLVKYHHQETVKLFPVDQLPDMAFDHADIIRAAHRQGRLYPQATAA